MTEYVKERMRDLQALQELQGSEFREYLGRQLSLIDRVLRKSACDAETHRLQGKAQILEDLITSIDGAFEEMKRLKLQIVKPDMNKAF